MSIIYKTLGKSTIVRFFSSPSGERAERAIPMKKIRKENNELVTLIEALQKEQKPIWRRVAELLARPRRKRVEVNVSELDSYANDQEVLLVPGKVLGNGTVGKKFTVAAYSFSEGARRIIHDAGGKMLTIPELKEANGTGKGIRIIA